MLPWHHHPTNCYVPTIAASCFCRIADQPFSVDPLSSYPVWPCLAVLAVCAFLCQPVFLLTSKDALIPCGRKLPIPASGCENFRSLLNVRFFSLICRCYGLTQRSGHFRCYSRSCKGSQNGAFTWQVMHYILPPRRPQRYDPISQRFRVFRRMDQFSAALSEEQERELSPEVERERQVQKAPPRNPPRTTCTQISSPSLPPDSLRQTRRHICQHILRSR